MDKMKYQFNSLDDIRDRKDQIADQMKESDREMKHLWNGLFKKPEVSTALSPTRRITSLVNNSAGIIDGLLLTWKLYRKFKKKK